MKWISVLCARALKHGLIRDLGYLGAQCGVDNLSAVHKISLTE